MTVTTTEAERAEFTVVYDGPALEDHTISVRDLAPALLGFADLMQEANATLNPEQPAPSLNIKATTDGSFLVQLALIHHEIRNFLLNPDTIALSVLVSLIGGPFGVLAYFRDRKKPGATEQALPNGDAQITWEDGTTSEYTAGVLRLTREQGVRRATQSVIAPLRREGINLMEVRPTPSEPAMVAITDSDVPNVDAVMTEEGRTLVTDHRYTAVLTIESPNYRKAGNKWQLNDGTGTHWMAVTDPSLREGVERHELKFGKDDRLRGEVWFRQWQTDSGALEADRTVTRVDEILWARPDGQTTVDSQIADTES